MNSFNYVGRGDRGRGRAADRRLGVRGRGRAGDLRLRRLDGHADRPAREGGGGRLPLLPRARPRPRRAACGAGRARCARSCPSCPRRGSGGSPSGSTSSARSCSSPAGSTRSGRRPWRPAPTPVAAANVDREPARRRGRRPGGGECRGAREARRGARPDPAAGVRRGDLAGRRPRIRRRAVPRPGSRLGRGVARADRRRDPRRATPVRSRHTAAARRGLLGFFVGQVMKETQGKANARVVSELVRAKLEA